MNNYDKKMVIRDFIEKVLLRRKKDIANHFGNFDNEIEINGNDLRLDNLDNVYSRIINNNINDDQVFEFTNKGIKILDMSPEIYRIIKENISKKISKLEISSDFINSSLFEEFPNLREVTANNGGNFESIEDKVIKLDIPKEGELAEKFKKYFVVSYIPIELGNKEVSNYMHIYDREESNDAPIFFGKILDKESINDVTIESSNIEKIVAILDWLEINNYKVDSIILKLEDKTYKDLELLRKYTSRFDIKISCGEDRDLTYEEFVNMRATIDWYKELLNSSNLSPFEKTIFAYDILKTFEYKEDEDDRYNSRIVPNILRTGNIVCVGYSKLFAELLNEEGIKARTYIIPPLEEGMDAHMRVVAKLDDEKYGIHGVYSFDATWDSVRKDLSLVKDLSGKYYLRSDERKDTDEIIKEYDALVLYTNFLISYKDYKNIYPKAELPEAFKVVEDGGTFGYEVRELFGKMNREEVKEYVLNSNKPTLSEFISALRIVREAEGYGNLIENNVYDLIELNKMIDEASDSNKTFFSDENVNYK